VDVTAKKLHFVLTFYLSVYIGRNSWKVAAEMVCTGVYLFFQVWFQVWRLELRCYIVGSNVIWSQTISGLWMHCC